MHRTLITCRYTENSFFQAPLINNFYASTPHNADGGIVQSPRTQWNQICWKQRIVGRDVKYSTSRMSSEF